MHAHFSLDLYGNNIELDGLQALYQSLQHNINLLNLYLVGRFFFFERLPLADYKKSSTLISAVARYSAVL